MSQFAFLLILVAVIVGVIYYFTTCRKLANIQEEAKSYVEQKDFEESSSDDDDGDLENSRDPNSPMSKMIQDMTLEIGTGGGPQSGVI